MLLGLAGNRVGGLCQLGGKIGSIVQRLRKFSKFLLKDVLLYDLALIIIVSLTFIFTGDLTSTNYSERIFWAGMVVFLIAGTLALSHMFPTRIIMFPYNVRRPEMAKKFIEETPQAQKEDEKRLSASIQFWLVGLVCLLIAALVSTLFGAA